MLADINKKNVKKYKLYIDLNNSILNPYLSSTDRDPDGKKMYTSRN